MTESASPYRGRFAPNPTGPLHFGSIITALASYLQARHQQGQWFVRIDDLDTARCVAGADSAILRSLYAYQLHWDGEIQYQSQQTRHYQAAFDTLYQKQLCYPCGCSRSEVARIASVGEEGPIYPGTCRNGIANGKPTRAHRARVGQAEVNFTDAVQGDINQSLEREVGDFVIKRADRLFAYQLATVVDDASLGITEIVRGSDLLFSTPRQVWLQQQLALSTPNYAHIPIAVNAAGEKLSKHRQAPAIDCRDPLPTLVSALRYLKQPLPDAINDATMAELLSFAVDNWTIVTIPSELTRLC